MLKPTFRSSTLIALFAALLCAGTFGAAQPASQTLDLNALENVPATVGISQDYLTVIEFEELIDSVRSSGGSQLSAEVADNIISVRAEQDDVNTDLIIRTVDGRTALFTLVSDPDAVNPKRYLVSDERPPEPEAQVDAQPDEEEVADAQPDEEEVADVQPDEEEVADVQPAEEPAEEEPTEEAPIEAQAPAEESTEEAPVDAEALPPGLDFEVSAYQPSAEEVVIQYVLTNNTDNLLANDPQRLRVYAGGETVPFERTLPPPGRAGRLQVGASESGEIVVPDLPADVDSLELEWALVEIGAGTVYRARRDLLAALGEAPVVEAPAEDPAAGAPSAEVQAASEPVQAEPDAAKDESADGSEEGAEEGAAGDLAQAQPAAPTGEASADGEPALLPPEIMEEIRRRGADITVIGSSFDEPGMTILTEEEAQATGASLVNTWFLYTRAGLEAEATVEDSEACTEISGESTLFRVQDIGLSYVGFPLTQGRSYRLYFEAYANQPVYFRSLVGIATPPYTESFARVEVLGTQKRTFLYTFEARNDTDLGRVAFLLGGNDADTYRICFDNVVLSEVGEAEEPALADAPAEDAASAPEAGLAEASSLNESFEAAAAAQAWSSYTTQEAEMDYEVVSGEVCALTNEDGETIWDVGLLRTGLLFTDDQAYTLTFEARADKPLSVRPSVALDELPSTEVFGQTVTVGTQVRTYSYTFDAAGLEERGGRLIFYLGGNGNTPYQVCLDNVTLTLASAEGANALSSTSSTTETAAPPATTPSEPATPPPAQTAAVPDDLTALHLVGVNSPDEVDSVLSSRLPQLGFDVLTEDDASAALGAAVAEADVVVVSASVGPLAEISALLRDAAVPVVTSNDALFGRLGMTGAQGTLHFGDAQDVQQVRLTAPGHPLSAGLSSPVTLSESPHQVAWGRPGVGAVVVATTVPDNSRAAIFAYEKGTPMIGVTAPERRVGLFLDAEGIAYSDDAWALFDAAVRWAVQ